MEQAKDARTVQAKDTEIEQAWHTETEKPEAVEATQGSPPLKGVRLLDLSRVLAGPFCTMLLADMGATVIKIEEPQKGDDTRAFGPPFFHGESAYFLSINRGKKSVTLNFKDQRGRGILKSLVQIVDVLVENFRPGVLDQVDLAYDQVKDLNPGLVYCSISGYGHTGPLKNAPGYDLVIQGLSGIMSLTGDREGPPYKVGTSIADLVTGLYASNAILLALLAREKTGKGQHLDISVLDSLTSLLTYQAEIFFTTKNTPFRMGNQHPSIAPYETFRASDGYFNLAVGNDRQWKTCCHAMGREDLVSRPEFATNPDRVKNRKELIAALEEIFTRKPVSYWLKALDEAGIPAGPILTVEEIAAHPQIQAREMVVEVQHSKAGSLNLLGNPMKLSQTPGDLSVPPPTLGEHTSEILRGLMGLSDEELFRLKEAGVI